MSIFSDYTVFQYLYPPRPESTIPPEELDQIAEGWIAQPKYNGSCAIVFINGSREFHLFNRHGERLTLQQPIQYTALNDSDKFMVLCGEYLNKNKKGEDGLPFNHKFVIWDILVWKGKYLIGETFENRLKILSALFGNNQSLVSRDGIVLYEHLQTTRVDNVFVAPSYVNHFKPLYDEIVQTDLYEGLVIKRAGAKLEHGYKEKNNHTWQFKARKQTKNYSF